MLHYWKATKIENGNDFAIAQFHVGISIRGQICGDCSHKTSVFYHNILISTKVRKTAQPIIIVFEANLETSHSSGKGYSLLIHLR